jgi:predicted helicase
MSKAERAKLEKVIGAYFKEIHKIYTGGDFREESFYPALKKLIEECSQILPAHTCTNVLVLPKKTEAGIPDFRIGKNGEIVGYIEAKPPDAGLREIEDSEQLKRYRESLPNLILTNFLEFRLYRSGNLIDGAEVGRRYILQSLRLPPVPEKLELFHDLLEKFFSFSIPEIQNSSNLSVELAKRTRFLEHLLREELSEENEEVTRLFKAFQEELIETLTRERFADLYAQTITYGLFAARMKALDEFKKETAWKFIPESLPLLKEIFYSMMGPHFPESLSWIVDDISQVLEKADIPSILKEFKTTRWDEDPVIHFYETFLATYNPKERERLGVYYTALPVVSYIVRSIHELLKDKFGKSEGLATRDVTLLDPAAGTLTFVVQAIKQVQNELEVRNKQGLITSYIEEHVLPNFHAFEILVAPYTVGHFKVSMVLEEMGYRLKSGERFQFYLTNTLEMKEPRQVSFLIDLAKEGQEAKRIKEKVPILVVLGNPPYSVSSENKSDFIETLMEDYKEDVRKERNIQPLSDDYIKFIRFAHWKIAQAGKGILGFVTNNSYFSGIIHRGMRRKLLETFDEIYLLNLHGSSRIGEKTPEGGKDENVFDIQQGVAIALYVKLEQQPEERKLYYADLWGLRERKYEYLFGNDTQTTQWKELKPSAPYYFFVPKDFTLQAEYEKFWKVTEIFKQWSSGVKTHRDHFVVGFKNDEIIQRMTIFTGSLHDELVAESLKLKDTRDWKIKDARDAAKKIDWEKYIRPYSYRPFDIRVGIYMPILIDRGCDRWEYMRHFFKENLGIALPRNLQKGKNWEYSFVTCNISDLHLLSILNTAYIFPLYLYPEKQEGQLFNEDEYESECLSNFNPVFLKALKESLGTSRTQTSEGIFYYIYAILLSPAYRKRYEEFLRIDFPRVPLPSDYEVFKELSNLGKEMVDLHLLKASALNETELGFPKGGSNGVEKVSYYDGNKRVFINKEQYFEGVSKDVWEYRIGAYQVMEKYLKDRKKRKLSLDEINHYMKVAKAIRLTIELQGKIDVVYEKIAK